MALNEKINFIQEALVKFEAHNAPSFAGEEMRKLEGNLEALKTAGLNDHVKEVIIKDSVGLVGEIAEKMKSYIERDFDKMIDYADDNSDSFSSSSSSSSSSYSGESRSSGSYSG